MQQSRFIALVDNYDRLIEVSEAAANSEDASLIQYSKTLDSLETKLNNISTTFQNFYMNIVNGEVIGTVLELINKLLEGITELGTLNSIFNMITIVKGIKTLFQILSANTGDFFAQVWQNYSSLQKQMTALNKKEAQQRAKDEQQARQQVQQSGDTNTGGSNINFDSIFSGNWGKIMRIGNLASIALTSLGIGINSFTNDPLGTSLGAVFTGVGNTASAAISGAQIGASIGGPTGALIGAIATGIPTLVAGINNVIKVIQESGEIRLEVLTAEAEQRNIERAEANQEYENLASMLDKYEEAREKRNDSEEDYQNWLDVNKQLVEAYPEMIGYIDEAGNVFADTTGSASKLAQAMDQASTASLAYYNSERARIEQEISNIEGVQWKGFGSFGNIPMGVDRDKEIFVNTFLKPFSQNKVESKDVQSLLDEAYTSVGKTPVSVSDIVNSINSQIIESGKNPEDFLRESWLELDNTNVDGIAEWLAFNALREAGIATLNEDKTSYNIAEDYLNYLSLDTQRNALQGVQSAQTQLEINNAINNLDSRYQIGIEAVKEIDNYLMWLEKTLDGEPITTENVGSAVGSWYRFLNSLELSGEEVNNLLTNLGDYSFQDLKDNFKIDTNNLTEPQKIIIEEYARIYKDYSQRLQTTLKEAELDPNLNNFQFFNVSQLDSITSYIADQQDIIDNEDLTESQKAAAKARQKLAVSIIDNAANFTSEQLQEIITALTTDPGTTSWANTLTPLLNQVDSLQAVVASGVYENVNTVLNQATEDIKAFAETLDNYTSKQAEGFDESQARLLLQALGKEESVFNEYFARSADGMYRLIDFTGTMNEFTEKLFVPIQDFGKFYNIDGSLKTLGEASQIENLTDAEKDYLDSFEDEDSYNEAMRQNKILADWSEGRVAQYGRIAEATVLNLQAMDNEIYEIALAGFTGLEEAQIQSLLERGLISTGGYLHDKVSNTYTIVDEEFKNYVDTQLEGYSNLVQNYSEAARRQARENAFQDGIISFEDLTSGIFGEISDVLIAAFKEQGLWNESDQTIDLLGLDTANEVFIKNLAQYFDVSEEYLLEAYQTRIEQANEVFAKAIENNKDLSSETINEIKKYLTTRGVVDVDDYIIDGMLDIRGLAYLGVEEAALFLSEQANTVQERLEQIYTDANEITLEDILNLYKSITGEDIVPLEKVREYQSAIANGTLENIYWQLLAQARSAGIKIDTSFIQDAAISLTSSIISSMEKAISGSINYEDLRELSKNLNISGLENFTTRTAEGLKLNNQGQAIAYEALTKQDAVAAQAMVEALAEQNVEAETMIELETRIKELREDISKLESEKDDTKAQQYRSELKLLEQIHNVRMQDADSYNLFDGEISAGYQGALNLYNSANQVANLLREAGEQGSLGAQDFVQLMDIAVNQLGLAGETFNGTMTTYADALAQSTNYLSNATGEARVDLSALASNLGMSVSDMVSSLAGSFDTGLKELAEQQIKWIDSMIAMLESFKTLADLESLDDGVFDVSELFRVEANGDIFISDDFAKWQATIEQQIGEIKIKGEKTIAQALGDGTITVDWTVGLANVINEIVLSDDAIDPYILEQQIREAVQQYSEQTGIEVDLGVPITSQVVLNETSQTYSIPGFEGTYATAADAVSAYYDQKIAELTSTPLNKNSDAITVDVVQEYSTSTTYRYLGEKGSESPVDGTDSGIEPPSDETDEINVNRTITYTIAPTTIKGDLEDISKAADEVAAVDNEEKREIPFELTPSDVQNQLNELKTTATDIGSKVYYINIAGNFTSVLSQLTAILNRLNEISGEFTTTITTINRTINQTSSSRSSNSIKRPSLNGKQNFVANAKGTLMGELGPELYVQNGRYQIAGQYGPEFVDLNDDAIVFNHLQTKRLMEKGAIGSRGKPVVSEQNSIAFATGNAMAGGGLDAAIQQLQKLRDFWSGILKNMSIQDLISGGSGGSSGGGGGSSGNTLTAVNQELAEWYNLSRQIANIEQEINNIIAKRANILEGDEYLRSLREQEALLNKQLSTQKILLNYQQLQLERQADFINQNKIWSQFLMVDENGLLQYRVGNEANGGKGALQVLQELNEMSAEEQISYMKKLGYSYTDQDGNALEGTDLVQQFFTELQYQIDQYDALYDTVNETESTLEELKSDIKDINDEILENQKDLEQSIYDIIVSAWEAEIDEMREQADLIKEANDKYITGIRDALSSERELYQNNQAIADRETLQRQLTLLRRSGGSASEIASLEAQLDQMLQDEYFTTQEQAIQSIEEASQKQIEQLETQIKIQEEALEYQKEHGIIWSQVYDVLQGSQAEILEFMQGNYVEFFAQSALQQEEMLTDWAKKIGIFTEDRKYNDYKDYAEDNILDTGAVWTGDLAGLQDFFKKLDEEDRDTLFEQYASIYANERVSGATHKDSVDEAAKTLYDLLKKMKEAEEAEANKPTTTPPPVTTAPPTSTNTSNNKGSSSSSSSSNSSSSSSSSSRKPSSSSGSSNSGGSSSSGGAWHYQINKNGSLYLKVNTSYRTREEAQKAGAAHAKRLGYGYKYSTKWYDEGGLVDYTGLAMVHGSKTKPESFLDAEDTKKITDALKESGKLQIFGDELIQRLQDISSSAANIEVSQNESSEINIQPGAIIIQVEQLNDAYDIEELSNDVMNRIVAIGTKATSRGVQRR